jgi:hypothetical protein
MRRWLCVLLGLAATLALAGTQFSTVRAYDPPRPCSCGGAAQDQPDYNIGACTASVGVGAMQMAANQPVWLKNANAPRGGYWQWTFTAQFKWSCSNLTIPQCAICWNIEIDYQAGNGQWIVSPGGISQSANPTTGSCNTPYITTLQDVYQGPAPGQPEPPGTPMRAVLTVASWDPNVSNDCVGQTYDLVASLGWYVPDNVP